MAGDVVAGDLERASCRPETIAMQQTRSVSEPALIETSHLRRAQSEWAPTWLVGGPDPWRVDLLDARELTKADQGRKPVRPDARTVVSELPEGEHVRPAIDDERAGEKRCVTNLASERCLQTALPAT